jgi:hypothetical protein
MSDTISVDVVGPSYWSYMATVMAECLDTFVEDEKIRPDEIPAAVYDGAKEFFALVLEAAGDVFPENPPASINAYVIASEALRGASKPFPATSQDLRSELERYSRFVDDLAEARRLTKVEDKETATALKRFFLHLAEDGEAEVYERSVRFEPMPAGYRFI